MNFSCGSGLRMPYADDMALNSVDAFTAMSSQRCATDTGFNGFPDFVPGNYPDCSLSGPTHKDGDKLAVSAGGAPVIPERDKGGGSDGDHLQQNAAPASSHSSSPHKRKMDLAMEEPKTKRCRASAKQNHKVEADDAKEIEKPSFIYVRARRGQATDSHSLAERVRRDKINKRMTLLRNLVPGCYQATGKAVVLEEIINYIKSLQKQVEILSMKLSVASQRYDLCAEMEKEVPLPLNEFGKNIMPIAIPEAGALPDYCAARTEPLHGTWDSLMVATTSAEEVPCGIGLVDANQCDVEQRGGFQDQQVTLWH